MDFHDSFSSWSHLLTSAWALFAGAFLLRFTWHHPQGRWACGVFAVTMVLLYLASGLFHGISYETVESKVFYQKLDKTGIFLFVAGSYTPVMAYLLRRRRRPIYLTAMWAFALFGIFSLWCLPTLPYQAQVGVYFAMTTIGILPTREYARAFGRNGVIWVVAVYTTYIIGAIVEVLQLPALVPGWFGSHEFLHLTDSVGTILHFGFVVKIVTRFRRRELAHAVRRTAKVPARRRCRIASESEHSLS